MLSLPDEALQCYEHQQKLPSPPRNTIRVVHEWLQRSDFGASFLGGTSQDVWDLQRDIHDFLTFGPSEGLSAMLARAYISLRRNLTRSSDRVYHVDSSEDASLAQGISVVISSILPVLPIVVLFFIKSLLVRIGLILVFTAVFAAVLVFGLKLGPEKVLTITTAYAEI